MHQTRAFLPRKGDSGFNWRTLLARKGDKGFNPTQVDTNKGATGFRPPAQPAYRAWLRWPWAEARPGRASKRRAETTNSTPGPTGVEGAGGTGGAWLRCPWVVAGPGRASSRRAEPRARGTGGSRAGRRPRAHQAARPLRTGCPAPGTPVGPQAARPGRQTDQPGPAGRTNHNLRNWAASRPTARSARNAILKSPGHPQCRRRSAPRAHQEKPR